MVSSEFDYKKYRFLIGLDRMCQRAFGISLDKFANFVWTYPNCFYRDLLLNCDKGYYPNLSQDQIRKIKDFRYCFLVLYSL